MLIALGVLVFLALIVYLIMGHQKKKAYRMTIDDLEILKYEVANKPVMFEIAKLKTVRKSERIVRLVGEWEKRWQGLENEIETVEANIAYAEELISLSDFNGTDEVVEGIEEDLAKLTIEIDQLLAEIESLKNSESRNRDGIIQLRESFSVFKNKYDENKATYEEFEGQFQEQFAEIESLFEQFDEHMQESNYDLADEVNDQIYNKIGLVDQLFNKIPMYRESVELELLPLLEGVLTSYSSLAAEGVYLDHLNIEEDIKHLKEKLGQVTGMVKAYDFDGVEQLLLEVEDRAKKLRESIKHEMDIKEAFDQDLSQLKAECAFVVKEGEALQSRYENIKAHCVMKSDDEDNFNALLREIDLVNGSIHSLVDEIEAGDAATSKMHGQVLGFLSQLKEIAEQLNMFNDEVEKLDKDSKDVVAESISLLGDINLLKSRFMKANFSHHRSSLALMLEKADVQINELLEEVNQMPLDINRVKSILDKAKMDTEKVKNEVGLLIEQLHLAERLMVYGNRYIDLEGIYLMDLTIAEDQFHQGNYEIVIEKMRGILSDVEGSKFDQTFEGLKQELECVLI